MPQPILLIAPENVANRVADALRTELDVAVETAPHRRAGMTALRRREFALLLLEEGLTTADPEGADALYACAGAVPVLEINFAITGVQRIVRQVRAALQRRAHDQAQARVAAAESLQNELNASLSGLLLETQLALREASPQQAGKLRHVVELAGDLRNRLRTT